MRNLQLISLHISVAGIYFRVHSCTRGPNKVLRMEKVGAHEKLFPKQIVENGYKVPENVFLGKVATMRTRSADTLKM